MKAWTSSALIYSLVNRLTNRNLCNSLLKPSHTRSSETVTEQEEDMERLQDQNPIQPQEAEARSHIWDCDSCLYDSFELKSFKRQLDSTIFSRTSSMPRQPPLPLSKRSWKIARVLRKILGSVFLKKPTSNSEMGVSVMCSSTGGVLPKIPDVWETDINCSGRISPEIEKLLVSKSASERFTVGALGVSSGRW